MVFNSLKEQRDYWRFKKLWTPTTDPIYVYESDTEDDTDLRIKMEPEELKKEVLDEQADVKKYEENRRQHAALAFLDLEAQVETNKRQMRPLSVSMTKIVLTTPKSSRSSVPPSTMITAPGKSKKKTKRKNNTRSFLLPLLKRVSRANGPKDSEFLLPGNYNGIVKRFGRPSIV